VPARLGVVRAPLASRMAAAAEQTPEQELQAKLVERLQAEFVSAVDLSDGCGSKFQCVIISTLFEGKPLLVRARDAAMSMPPLPACVPAHQPVCFRICAPGPPKLAPSSSCRSAACNAGSSSASQRSPQGGDGCKDQSPWPAPLLQLLLPLPPPLLLLPSSSCSSKTPLSSICLRRAFTRCR
jgi:hypothetical protein